MSRQPEDCGSNACARQRAILDCRPAARSAPTSGSGRPGGTVIAILLIVAQIQSEGPGQMSTMPTNQQSIASGSGLAKLRASFSAQVSAEEKLIDREHR
jgi:hypothetical protein